MDHSLRTVSYIADIGDILVIMARRRMLSSPGEEALRKKKQAKVLCHVFESDEVSLQFAGMRIASRDVFSLCDMIENYLRKICTNSIIPF